MAATSRHVSPMRLGTPEGHDFSFDSDNAPHTPSIVDRMPPEILVYIFQLVQWATGWQSYPSHTTPAWISFTWVCRRWRAVALSAPVLWTSIGNAGYWNSLRWLPVFLERAAGAPLDVDITLRANDRACAETLRTIQPYSFTIRCFRLCLDNPEEDAYRQLVSPLTEEMRNVEELTLLAFLPFGQIDAGTINASRDQFPRLTSLRLIGPHIPWSSSVYTGLRSLKINSTAHPPSPLEFFQILRGCPDLEILEYGIGLPTPSNLGPDGSETSYHVSLPRMRQMNLKGTLPEVEFISQYIQVPSTCSIRIHLSGTYDDPVAALVPQQRMLQPLLRTCTIFTLSTNYGLADLCMKCGEDYLRMICSVDDFSRLNPETWYALLGASRHSPIVHFRLSLDVVGAILSEMWMECFYRFPLLEHVALGTHWHHKDVWDATSFLSALASPAADGRSVALTRLRVLELTSVRLDEPTVLSILSMLERRASGGAPLSELVLNACYYDTDIDTTSLVGRLQKLLKLSIRYAEE